METEVHQKAKEAETLVNELNEIVLPAPSADLVPLPEADAPTQEEIRTRMSEIDMGDTNSIVSFGSTAQAELQQISQAMLAGVKNKDVGPAGDSLRDIVGTIRGFSVDELDPNRKQSWWERLFGKAKPVHDFLAKYEDVQEQIDKITDNLLAHEHTLMKDIKSLDKLYEKTLDFYDELALYIAAGEEKIKQLDDTVIPAKEAEVQAAPEDQQILKAQELRDLRAARDDLERRVHDLKLTRQVTMQSLPSIRLVQENDKSLVTKINSTLVNTVPLWETQLAQAVTIQRSTEAAKAVKEATDLTNQLLTQNAANLRESNKMVRAEMERGVFDIEAVKTANAELIATINESLEIADEGKRKRAEAEAEMVKMEAELRDTLSAASARRPAADADVIDGDAQPVQR
ncbi:toxic anion resistance protein [Gymnodinialimonas sp. 2305UL16-5]|uniref:toxic anion resistance protein n=1 Tax=Gymnodinialimonas mytili TaxID=3126503 RepID=UPI0030ABAFAC